MKTSDLKRPDKLILSSIKTLGNFTINLYSEEKRQSKGMSEITLIGEKKTDNVETQFYRFNEEDLEYTKDLVDFTLFNSLSDNHQYWLNFHGLHDVELIKKFGQTISLDQITIRQILDTTLRPKVEEFDGNLFFSVKSILKNDTGEFNIEQLSFLLGKNYVISFQEERGDHFDFIRNKIDNKIGLIRKRSADYLLYQLLDAIMDNYFETIDSLNSDIKSLEMVVLSNPTQDTLVHIEQLKQLSEIIKKALAPFKDSLERLINRKTQFINEEHSKYFVDLVNSCRSAIENLGTSINSLDGLTNIYFSALSHKMNQAMKVLTTVATIFIPLTFIAGIYGMNFENMPELKMANGYFYALGAMGSIFIGMLVLFRWKKWL